MIMHVWYFQLENSIYILNNNDHIRELAKEFNPIFSAIYLGYL